MAGSLQPLVEPECARVSGSRESAWRLGASWRWCRSERTTRSNYADLALFLGRAWPVRWSWDWSIGRSDDGAAGRGL